jgi:hypothetical protein
LNMLLFIYILLITDYPFFYLDFHPKCEVLIACILLVTCFMFDRSDGKERVQERATCSKSTKDW